MNIFLLIISLAAIGIVSVTIAVFELKGATFRRNTMFIVLFLVGIVPGYLYSETMTGVIYQLPCAVLGLLIGLNIPTRWITISK
jgi:hypothetical protein